ncbi:DUF3592 domain-containing protein [Rhizobium sp. BK068]|uniref:DUF3592 domain-containing protein n=1 Tax=Rhizobium sp. BK068 TaxID=2512130 RepID=UPI001042C1BF|nr:DUF3592 domain-containing protein [Rhizobium sp. BK068]TCM77094.1 hypothetical protein EV291_108113 [Rhizobium sp. BK068]
MYYLLMVAAFVIFLIVIPVLSRWMELRRTSAWRPALATIVRARPVLIGEASVVFVDVAYILDGIKYDTADINTHSEGSLKAFPIGGDIGVLVDPRDPTTCVVERKTPWDGIFRLPQQLRLPTATK